MCIKIVTFAETQNLETRELFTSLAGRDSSPLSILVASDSTVALQVVSCVTKVVHSYATVKWSLIPNTSILDTRWIAAKALICKKLNQFIIRIWNAEAISVGPMLLLIGHILDVS